ncbi:MAG: hypothetical protein M3Q19_05875 [Pseudomonadota bacterium]|nr:hypothetical protein [Pseudomonadota bacterium]
MKLHLLSLTALLPLVACTQVQSVGSCGESFCVPADAKLLGKRTPVEDFNIYQVAWRGSRFTIYEGNHPEGNDDAGGTVVGLPRNRAGTLRVGDREGSLIFDTQLDWPAYIDVMGPCPSIDNCPVKSLAREITFRT